jgi:hypothetical protein
MTQRVIGVREGGVGEVTRRARDGIVGRQNRIVKKQASQFFFFDGRRVVLFVVNFFRPNNFSFRWKGKAKRQDNQHNENEEGITFSNHLIEAEKEEHNFRMYS